MREKIKVISCCLYAIIVWAKNKITRKHCDNKKVIILFQQIFGDAVMISDSLKYYTQLYPREKGCRIIFVSKPAVNQLMHDVLPLPDDIDFEILDFKRIQTDYKYFRNMVSKYGNGFGTLIVPGTTFSPELFSITSTASQKIGLLPSIPRTKPYPLVWLQSHAYNSVVRPGKEMNMIQRHRMLLNHLGLKNVKGRLPTLLPQEKVIDGKYCVICPGSSMDFKIWPIDRFVTIIDRIVKNYDLNVYLTGGKGEEKYADAIISMTKYPQKVITRIGTTTFKEWTSIIQYSLFVLGNDSATIHLAAAARKPAICIAGIYEKLQFFPYAVDELKEGDILPITLYTNMKCEYCRTISYFAGCGNEECKRRIKNGKCASCIDAINVETVWDNIEEIMRGVNI